MQNALFDVFYKSMCPRCVRELTKCQKTKPSLFSSVPKSLKTELIQICVRYDVNHIYQHSYQKQCLMCFVWSPLGDIEKKKNNLSFSSMYLRISSATQKPQQWSRYDVISEMWAGFRPTALSETLLSETMPDCFGRNMVFVYISKHR